MPDGDGIDVNGTDMGIATERCQPIRLQYRILHGRTTMWMDTKAIFTTARHD